MERRTFLKLAALVPGLALAGCGGSKTLLSPKDPTMLSIWHVYGEQADSPMNRLLTEFNDTVGREKGILLNVTNMTNSAAIGGQLQDAKAGKPGALDLPDLFSAHPADASALGIENLVDWNDWFTAEEAGGVPGVQIHPAHLFERLPVRPVCGGHRGAAFHPCHMGRLF